MQPGLCRADNDIDLTPRPIYLPSNQNRMHYATDTRRWMGKVTPSLERLTVIWHKLFHWDVAHMQVRTDFFQTILALKLAIAAAMMSWANQANKAI